MDSIFEPLTDEELEQLDDFLLYRIDDDADTEGKDEGVLDISELDGLFTAIVSGPELIPPSLWLPAVWGDFEPAWESMEEFEEIHSLMMRHMNGIAGMLIDEPQSFEPIFEERVVKGKVYTIVDEWCEGYVNGVELAAEQWHADESPMLALLAPIRAYTSKTDWLAHSESNYDELEPLRDAITSNVRKIHAFWLARREHLAPSRKPLRGSEPCAGRNDPCPCGSGKKFKKCCLH